MLTMWAIVDMERSCSMLSYFVYMVAEWLGMYTDT